MTGAGRGKIKVKAALRIFSESSAISNCDDVEEVAQLQTASKMTELSTRWSSTNWMAIIVSAVLVTVCVNAHAERSVPSNFDTALSRATGVESNDGFGFGDVTNYYTGETSFHVLGPSLPGNNNLPIGRPRVFQAYDDGRDFVFGWISEGPYLSGIYSAGSKGIDGGWVTDASPETDRAKRCSRPNASAGAPIVSSTGGKEGVWEPSEYWKGVSLHKDGKSMHLNAIYGDVPNMPTSGGPYKWATNEGWFFSCITLPSGGEGFVGVTPNGERYYFDTVSRQTPHPQLKKYNYLGDTRLDVSEVRISASRHEDRFGNWVEGDIASDGRVITWVQESGTRAIATVGSRNWMYDRLGQNMTITYPDSSIWKLEVSNGIIRNDYSHQACGGSIYLGPRYSGTATVSITLRSGAKGVFEFAPRNRGISEVYYRCLNDGYNGDLLQTQNLIQGIALVSKTISGLGMPTVTTTINYGSSNNCFSGPYAPLHVACVASSPRTRVVTVSKSSGEFSRYTFGNRAQVDDGLLLKLELGDSSSSISRVETYLYRQFDSIGSPVGISEQVPQHWARYRVEESERTIVQDGVTFKRTVSSFDSFARPTSITKSSTHP